MDTPTPIQVDLGRIAQDLQIRRVQVESVVALLDEGNTVPFITRYRKERTGNLNEVAIREIQVRVGRLRDLAERKETILKAIEAQGKLNDELATAIRAADNPKRLEDLYLPYKPKKKSKASDAREKGLEPLALGIWNKDEAFADLSASAANYLNAEKEIDSAEKALEGAGHIIAEMISELAPVRDALRRVVWRTGKIVTTKADNVPEGQGLEYRDYFNYSEPTAHIPPHRVLAINRGDKEGPLKVRLEVPRPELESALFGLLPLEGHPHAEYITKAAADALDRLLMPSLEREVRRDLTEMAERHAVDVFARNLRSLLLQPPIPRQAVIAIDPGFRTGCKVAVLDGYGNLLDHCVIHPHQPQNRRHEAKQQLKDLVGKHKVGVIAIGNGTACRETEELVAEVIAEGTHFHLNPGVPMPVAHPPAAPAAPAHVEEAHAQTEPEAAASEPPAAEAPAAPAEAQPSETPPPAEGAAPAAESSAPAPPAVEHSSGSAQASDAPAAEPPADGSTPHAPENHATENHTSEHQPEPALPPISGGSPESDVQPELTGSGSPAAEVPSTPEPTVDHSAAAPEAVSEAASAEPTSAGSEPAAATEPQAQEAPVPEPVAEEAAPSAPADVASEAKSEEPPAQAAAPAQAPAHAHGPKSGPVHKPGSSRPPRPKPAGPPPPPAPHAADSMLAQLAYVIVNEAGASVYSTSPVGREEFPEFDATLRSAISIGRRLQDPLSELVKIEPQNIGVGLYQHDVNPKQLKESLESVIESCVNFVGVDLNTASVSLLRHVSGLNQLTARRVVDFRKEKGPFAKRDALLEVDGIGPATFTQSAGFLKITGGEQPLDRTWVHPESYTAAQAALEKLGFSPEVTLHRDQLPALHEKMNQADLPALARELSVGEPTLHDIFEALARPERDPRDDLPKPIFKKGVLKLEDLSAGMELKGTVLNVVDFGAFVDIGLKDSGLVHISQLANRYIKSPHDVVSVGDVVTVWVMGVDQERKRVSLTMVKPGTERPRGQGGGGGRRGGGEGREGGGGGERRSGGGRGRRGQGAPRREPTGAPQGQAQQPTPAGAGASAGGPAAGPRPERPTGPAARGPGGEGPHGPGGGRPSGPPHRQQGGGPGRGPRQGAGQGGHGRFERAQAPRPQPKPSKPAPPPPPLSKDALSGSVPLRTFGQLKQLWQARSEDAAPPEAPPAPAPSAPSPAASAPPAEPPAAPSVPAGQESPPPAPPSTPAPAEPPSVSAPPAEGGDGSSQPPSPSEEGT